MLLKSLVVEARLLLKILPVLLTLQFFSKALEVWLESVETLRLQSAVKFAPISKDIGKSAQNEERI